MIATINTATKTITLESSFKHPEWVEFFNTLPEEWQNFTFEVGTGDKQVSTWPHGFAYSPNYPYYIDYNLTGTGDPRPKHPTTTSKEEGLKTFHGN